MTKRAQSTQGRTIKISACCDAPGSLRVRTC